MPLTELIIDRRYTCVLSGATVLVISISPATKTRPLQVRGKYFNSTSGKVETVDTSALRRLPLQLKRMTITTTSISDTPLFLHVEGNKLQLDTANLSFRRDATGATFQITGRATDPNQIVDLLVFLQSIQPV
jgi:hypothetical protein